MLNIGLMQPVYYHKAEHYLYIHRQSAWSSPHILGTNKHMVLEPKRGLETVY